MKKDTKINIIGIYLFITLIILICIPLLTYFYRPFNDVITSLIYVACSGGIGGTVYAIRGFYQHLFRKDFNLRLTWWYIFRPLISIVAGAFVYFLIIGGLISLSSATEINYSKSILFYCAVSFLAGFSFTQFTDKLEEIALIIFRKGGKK